MFVCTVVPTSGPQTVSITEKTAVSFLLSWNPPTVGEQNGILIQYHVIIKETQIHYSDNATEIRGMDRYLNRTYNISEGRTQLIGMLHPDYNYTVSIAAATEPGIGPFSDAITMRTSMDGEYYLKECYIKCLPICTAVPEPYLCEP